MRAADCLLILLLVAGHAMAEGDISLENDSLCVRWDAGSGCLVSLKDKSCGREWLAPSGKTPLYSIVLADPAATISSAEVRETNVRREGEAVVVESTHEEPAGFTVTCRFRFETDSGQLLERIGPKSLAALRKFVFRWWRWDCRFRSRRQTIGSFGRNATAPCCSIRARTEPIGNFDTQAQHRSK